MATPRNDDARPGPQTEARKRGSPSVWVSVLGTAVLLGGVYIGVWLLPRLTQAVAARSLYNYREIAEQARARKDYDAAVAVIERAAREIPRGIYYERAEYMYDWIGRIRQEQGRVADSLAAFLRAQRGFFRNIQLRGYLPPPRLVEDIIEAYFATGNPAGAYHEALAALDLYPMMDNRILEHHAQHAEHNPQVMRDLAVLNLRISRLSVARDRLQRSLARAPRLPEAHYWLGRLAETQQTTAAAVTAYQAELAAFPYEENARARLLRLFAKAGRDLGPLRRQRDEIHARAVAAFLPADRAQPLASLFGIHSAWEQTFDLDGPGRVLVSLLAHSTPCQAMYGWVEVKLDDRHVQTLYVHDPLGELRTMTYHVWLERVAAGRHVLRIENLTDAADAKSDRNVFIHNLRLFRVDGTIP